MSSPPEWVNAKQAAGEHQIKHAALFDAEVRPHNERFRAATQVGPRDQVLDIGCGTGQSTRQAARVAIGGSALGVDLSAAAVQLARRISDQEGLRNAVFQQADAQVHRFKPRHYDLCISQFGTMFFADPVAAFSNIGNALRPQGRLVMLVWQGRDRNEWSTAINRALAGETGTGAPGPAWFARSPDPFALGDQTRAEDTLAASGFAEVGFTDVDEPIYYGPDPGVAYDFVLGLRDPKDVLARLDAETADHARDRLRATLEEHATRDGVFFGSRAWIITARRP
jgi:SAM-dependent methyltransferase